MISTHSLKLVQVVFSTIIAKLIAFYVNSGLGAGNTTQRSLLLFHFKHRVQGWRYGGKWSIWFSEKSLFFFIPSLGYGFHPALLLLVWWGSICLPSGSHNTERMLKRHQKFFSGCKTALKLSSTYHVPFLYASKNSHLMEKKYTKSHCTVQCSTCHWNSWHLCCQCLGIKWFYRNLLGFNSSIIAYLINYTIKSHKRPKNVADGPNNGHDKSQ